MVKDIRTKVIKILPNKRGNSLNKQLNKFFQKEGLGLSLKDVKITHAYQMETVDFCGKIEGSQIYTVFYSSERERRPFKKVLSELLSYKIF